ncbi:Terminal uridylyltransferase 7 [Carex littledalei]|uniref:Terminal uridylyltransferase 7 n=1 Tax=Carex littledalei TaxID=544730 RepID=A0A833VPD8_9POAL|nr:Terminal uridylyltransferase 7 [Carex littledalei]
MASLASGLCKTATINELREWTKVPLDQAFLRALDGLLLEIYETLRPKPIHYEQRNMLVAVFNKMVTKIFGKSGGFPVVEEFGSFKMNLFTAESDLDLSVNFSDSTLSTSVEYSRAEKIKALRKLSKILYAHQRQGHVRGVLPIMSARVPVLKATDCGTGVECDISIENKDGISRSAIISLVSSIDERFRILCYLIKMWAKANDINSSKDRTLSSMAIIALVAFHLQTRNPPIVPPFSALLRGGTSISNVKKSVLQFENFGRGNKESIAELFISLICKLTAVENLWNEGLCASMFEGTWVYKRVENISKAAGMNVEDFLDQSDNFARSVGKDTEMKVIKDCTQKALNYLTRFLSGDIDSYKLKTCLFGPVFSTLSPTANKRLAWEDIPIPPIERDAVPGRSKLDKKRKHEHVSSKASNAKRSRYDVPQAQQEPTPVYADRYHQGLAGGFHFTDYEQRLPRIPYPIPDPYLSRASAHLLAPRSGYGQNPINPSGPGFVMTPRQFSHGPDILPTTNSSHQYHQHDSVYRYHQPDPVYRYGRGYRE